MQDNQIQVATTTSLLVVVLGLATPTALTIPILAHRQVLIHVPALVIIPLPWVYKQVLSMRVATVSF